MFGALISADLTYRQGVIFRYIAKLLMSIPSATIYTLLRFMQEPETVREYLPNLDLESQYFFETQFFNPMFNATREQIAARLWNIISIDGLKRMIGHKKNKVNLFDSLNRGSIILIHTDKKLLEKEGSEVFGKFMLALIAQAALERAVIPEEKRKPTFVYVDEAADYLDETMEELLNQARKFKVGVILSHQNLGQFSPTMRDTVMASTAIKLVGGVSVEDARRLAPELRMNVDDILALKKDAIHTEFALFVKGMTSGEEQQQSRFTVPFGMLEGRPTLTDEEYQELLALNRKRIGAPPEQDVALTRTGATTHGEGADFRLDRQKVL